MRIEGDLIYADVPFNVYTLSVVIPIGSIHSVETVVVAGEEDYIKKSRVRWGKNYCEVVYADADEILSAKESYDCLLGKENWRR